MAWPECNNIVSLRQLFGAPGRGQSVTETDAAAVVATRHPAYPSVAILRIDRMRKKNALRPVDIEALGQHLARLQVDPEVSLIIITGSGDAFCAGADINMLNALSGDALASFIEMQVDFLSRVVMAPKIVVAAVNGASSGFGNHLIACCDLCVIEESAVLHFTGAAKGLPSLLMGTLVMPMTIGLKRAKSLYLRGGKLSAQQAVDDGLANYSVPAVQWDSELDKLAAEFSGRSNATMAHNKFQLNQGVFQMLGAAKLSGLAGAATLSPRDSIPAGRLA